MNENDTRPLMVSIWCTTYNQEPYIRQCLEGFVMQKTDFRFEAIVHDDASTDGTAAIVREYAEKYPDIIKPIFETENQYSKGDGSLDRIMEEVCTGKYVAFCEGDDYWIDPLKLQKQVDFLENNPDYSMCFHNAIVMDDDNGTLSFFLPDANAFEVSINDIINNWIVPTASIICIKKAISKPNWLVQIYSGDYSLILRCLNSGKIYNLGSVMSVYRKSLINGSASSRMLGKEIFVREQHILLLESFNTGTRFKYSNIISRKILENKQIISYIKKRKKGLLFCIFEPYFYKIIKDKFLNNK